MRWGRIPAISQYVLIFIAVTFTWLMGLMGYVRSGLRQHWHVYGVIRDHSADAFTPTLGFATQVVSVTVLMFFLLIGFVFWISSLHDRPDFERARPASRRLAELAGGTPQDVGDDVMRIPHIVRIGALVLATTGFYAYVGQMVPQKEVQPPQETALRSDLTTADMVKVGREIMEGKGLCLTCHTIGKTGALRFPDLEGVGARAKTRVPGLSDVEYLAQSMYEPTAFVVPGFPPAMPPINQPPIGLTDQEILCVIAYLQTLGGTPTVTLQTTTATTAARPHRARRRLPRSSGTAGPRRAGCTMNILVVLAVAAVFGLLRFRRASLLLWAGAWWVGIYVLLRFGFTAPIPSSVVSLYMGIVSIAILAYVSSSQERREEVSRPLVRFMTEKRYTALLGATVVAIPALAAANVYVQMNVPLEPPLFSRTVHPASPSEITVHDKKIDLDAGENPFRHLETSNPAEFRKHVENGRQVYYRNCVFCHGDNLAGNGMFVHGLDPIPTNFADQGTIAMLRDTFLFWRISKGGPGLPEEGGPWDTAMPAWEKLLKEEEIWEAILFLYDFTGQKPRAKEEAAHK